MAHLFEEERKQKTMKLILTLLMAAGTFGTLHAQTREETRRVILGERKDNGSRNDRNNRDVVYGDDDYDRYPNNRNNGNRQYQIDQINHEYDNKINSIRNNRYLSNGEKERTIRQLERDRQQRLAEINRGYNDRDRRYDDDYDRKDNGKHKGWAKKNKNKNWRKGARDRDWND
jgi:hypothetical protein